MKMSVVPALSALVLIVASCAKHPYVPLSQRPQLQGNWVINTQESPNPRVDRPLPEDRARGGQDGATGGRGGRGGRGGIGGARGGVGGPRGGIAGAGGQVLETMRWATEHLRTIGQRIEVALTDSTVAISYADTTTLTLPTNGKEQKLTWRRVGEMEARASWNETGLRIERKLEGGVKIKETFTRAPDSSRLIVELEVDGPLSDIKTRRVYDPAGQAEGRD